MYREERMIVFVHIPKTGGTTILKNMQVNNKVYHVSAGAKIHPPDIWKYDLVLGHFDANEYSGAPMVSFLREPVGRMISHFNFLKRKCCTIASPKKNRRFEIKNDFVEFSEIMGNILLEYTGGRLEKFSFIGEQENLYKDLEKMCHKFKLKFSKEAFNERRIENKLIPRREEIEKVEEIIKDDIEFYKSWRSRWN